MGTTRVVRETRHQHSQMRKRPEKIHLREHPGLL